MYNSSNRQAIDIEAGATILSKRDVPGGERSYVVKRLDVVAPSMEVLGPKRNLGDLMGLSPVRVFAARIPDEFDKHLSGESTRLAFTLRATDALSGTTVVFRRLYGKSDIRYGEFRYGLAFDVEPTKREGSCNNEGEEGAGP
ncbi:MAG: hypothetical protein FJY85_23755 [Deltaproteobacteria bacterium]|nr:hypothetical protein [Deltaproteobacteria bacterium]